MSGKSPRSNAPSSARSRVWLTLALVVAIAAVVAGSRASTIREWWLGRKSLEDLRAAAEGDRKDSQTWSLYAERLLAAGQGEVALAAFVQALESLPETDPKTGPLTAGAAYSAARFGREDQAAELVEKAKRIRAGDVRTVLAAGILAMRRKDFAEAEKCFGFVTKERPKDPEGWSRLGTSILAAGRPEFAVTPLEKALQLEPKNPSRHADLAEAHAQQNQFAKARDGYAKAAELAPYRVDYLSQYALASASAARSEEEYEQAATLLTTATQATPDDATLFLTLAGLQMRFGRMEEARRTYETTVGMLPDHSDAWFNLSNVYARLGDRSSAAFARKHFQEILDRQTRVVELTKRVVLAPQNAQLLVQLSDALRMAGDNSGAFRALQQAGVLLPKDAKIQARLQAAMRAMSGQPGAGRN